VRGVHSTQLNSTHGTSFPCLCFVNNEKHTCVKRDYAASASMIRSVAEEGSIKTEQYDDLLYTFYLDDTSVIPSGKQRFSGGMLLDKQQTKEFKPTLMALNEQRPGYEEGASATALYQNLLHYESCSVPSVDAAVANFPFTNGFVSALIHDFKV
jgi:hypothetical protein